MQKQIKDILTGVNVIKVYGDLSKNVSGIKYNSKQVASGDIFVCLKGQHYDGQDFIKEALNKGAVGIVGHKDIGEIPKDKVFVLVDDTEKSLSIISSNFYDHPSKKVLLIGVTGTNGKTTITYILESIFRCAGYSTGVIGTINYRYGEKVFPSSHTTPFSSDLQEILYNMVTEKIEVVIMEVSSHSLVQNRVRDCEFDVAVFTNLTSEHLDFHKTMEEYFNAKSILFKTMSAKRKEIFSSSLLGEKSCVINIDDEWGQQMVNECSISNILTFGRNKTSNFKWNSVKPSISQTQFELKFNGKTITIETPLIGDYNISNIVASFVVAYSQKLEIQKILDGIKNVKFIPGRLEKVDINKNFNVIIDYAHTPDALEKVIKVIKRLPHNRIIVVFGCGGDRDRTKRPLMGKIATELADYVILTSDNPRTEDPYRIILDIEVGIKRSNNTNYEICVDRKEAIFKALKFAKDGDIILLAGKGHEDYQIIGENKIHFDEREIVKEMVSLL
jgi:UDP-N-acetylmuramoyl-L-alanyl-D-glutamate--2,6-diaminopimelate ligase